MFYRYNDILKESKCSVVTDDCIATEKIQNQNWQYFVKSVLDVFKWNDIGKTIRQPQAQLLLDNVENVAICTKTYQSLYKYLEQILYLTVENLSAEEYSEITDDFTRKNYRAKHVPFELDCWLNFFFSKGSFPGFLKLKFQNLLSHKRHCHQLIYIKNIKQQMPKLKYRFKG